MPKTALTALLPFALLLASCGGGPSAPAASAPTTVSSSAAGGGQSTAPSGGAGDQTMSAQEAQILAEVNVARAQARSCGGQAFGAAPAVTWNGYLAAAARGHAADMAERGYFNHVTPEGRTPAQRMEAAGYRGWTQVGENIAAGYTAQNVVQGWLDSPSHCKTLMDPGLKELGVGYTYRPGSTYGTYWVQNFGTR
ncbi:CAP domain-containing protein [Deinococcus multiflagellatus]|uniref:CAP domain-containing protein n=1 Tax=Deinococcus multiflagellatus TaxID=1656887 RepID=UPI001CD00F45|nr:CAP domain-containing protein [Deinococcus multiflagellatus]MBZ9713176.1 CAP domain-containing protein [Deinococcus multiflagellatus]